MYVYVDVNMAMVVDVAVDVIVVVSCVCCVLCCAIFVSKYEEISKYGK